MPASSEARYIRTTVKVRQDLHQKAKRRGVDLSEVLNESLSKRFERPKGQPHPLLGVLKGTGTSGKDWRKDWADIHREAGHEW